MRRATREVVSAPLPPSFKRTERWKDIGYDLLGAPVPRWVHNIVKVSQLARSHLSTVDRSSAQGSRAGVALAIPESHYVAICYYQRDFYLLESYHPQPILLARDTPTRLVQVTSNVCMIVSQMVS